MNEVCVDASLIVKLAQRGEFHRDKARQLVLDAGQSDTQLIAPPMFESELDTIIRRRVYDGRLTSAEAQRASRGLDSVIVKILNPAGVRYRAREIAAEFNQSRVYDSTYAALAEIRGCEFWTADRAYCDDVSAELHYVRYLADYPMP